MINFAAIVDCMPTSILWPHLKDIPELIPLLQTSNDDVALASKGT